MNIHTAASADYRGLEFVGDYRDPEAEQYILDSSAQLQQAPTLGEIAHTEHLNSRLSAMGSVMSQIASEVNVDISDRMPPLTAYRLYSTQEEMNASLASHGLPETAGQGFCSGINMYVVAERGDEEELLGTAAHELGHFVAKRRLEILPPPNEEIVIRTYGLSLSDEAHEPRRMIDEPLMDILKADQINRWRTTERLSDLGEKPDEVALSYPGVFVLSGLIKAVAKTNRTEAHDTYKEFLKGHFTGDEKILSDVKESLPSSLHDAYEDYLRANPNSFEESTAAAVALKLAEAKQALDSYSDKWIKTPRILAWLDDFQR